MVLCMIFAHDFWMRWFSVHGIGRDGFRSMVLDASACINMYCNIDFPYYPNMKYGQRIIEVQNSIDSFSDKLRLFRYIYIYIDIYILSVLAYPYHNWKSLNASTYIFNALWTRRCYKICHMNFWVWNPIGNRNWRCGANHPYY